METTLKWPTTDIELSELLGKDGTYKFDATWDEYWELLSEVEYNADYYNHQIIATMSYEADIHSQLAVKFTLIFASAFKERTDFRVFNSNRPVFIEDCAEKESGVFISDGMVIALPSEKYEYQPGMSAETTPIALVEILSKSTRTYDYGTKLPCYKNILSLQQIIYVEQNKCEIVVLERKAINRWEETTYTNREDSFEINGQSVSLKSIYQNIL